MAALSATHAKRDAIVLHASRGFASAPNSPRVFLQSKRCGDLIQQMIHSDKPTDTSIENMVVRICAMFPTAREYDVRELLEKYHYREAVVVSALQVMKYPLTMPGPATVGTPPVRGRFDGRFPPQTAWSESEYTTGMSDGRQSKLGGLSTYSNTPLHSPSPRRPPHSPKIKLKYLKSVFPKAEETYLLDLLSSSDNNVQHVTQHLLDLGHQKKDHPAPLTPRRVFITPSATSSIIQEPVIVEPTPKKIPSIEEKTSLIEELQKQFPDEEEVVIQLALESADYELEKASLILSNSQNRDESYSSPCKTNLTLSGIKHTITLSSLKSSPSVMSTFKDIATLYSPVNDCGDGGGLFRVKPRIQKMESVTDETLYRGTNSSLLEENYVTPSGARPGLAKGPNSCLRISCLTKAIERVKVQGANPQNRQGPSGLARGSLSSLLSKKVKPDTMRRI